MLGQRLEGQEMPKWSVEVSFYGLLNDTMQACWRAGTGGVAREQENKACSLIEAMRPVGQRLGKLKMFLAVPG